jgi:hypothetical protein
MAIPVARSEAKGCVDGGIGDDEANALEGRQEDFVGDASVDE